MGKIIDYRNEGKKGVYCNIKLDSGENVLISVGQTDVRIFKMILGGTLPIKTIWKSKDIKEMVKIFADLENIEKHPLDAIKDKIINCKSIKEIEELLSKKK